VIKKRLDSLPGLGRIEARIKTTGQPMPQTVVSSIKSDQRFIPPIGQVLVEGAYIERADFRDTWWDAFYASGTIFVDCDFRRARFGHAVLGARSHPTTFRRCRFDNADLRNAHPDAARFEDCHFDRATIEDWRCFLAEFVRCHFAGKIVGVIFSGRPWGPGADKLNPPRKTNEFRGNDFRHVDLIDCSFVRGVDIGQQLLPVDGKYVRLDRAAERFASARKAVSMWPDLAARAQALRMIAVYSSAGYEEQDELFIRRDNLTVVPADIRDRVWKVLEEG
jgi:hypothetical protein